MNLKQSKSGKVRQKMNKRHERDRNKRSSRWLKRRLPKPMRHRSIPNSSYLIRKVLQKIRVQLSGAKVRRVSGDQFKLRRAVLVKRNCLTTKRAQLQTADSLRTHPCSSRWKREVHWRRIWMHSKHRGKLHRHRCQKNKWVPDKRWVTTSSKLQCKRHKEILIP